MYLPFKNGVMVTLIIALIIIVIFTVIWALGDF
jgi:hypothetical protein